MKKNDLIAAVAENSKIDLKSVKRVLRGFAEVLDQSLRQPGDTVAAPGIGKFVVASPKGEHASETPAGGRSEGGGAEQRLVKFRAGFASERKDKAREEDNANDED